MNKHEESNNEQQCKSQYRKLDSFHLNRAFSSHDVYRDLGHFGALYFSSRANAPDFRAIERQPSLVFLAVWAPAIAAFIIIGIKTGFSGLRRYLSRVLKWRASVAWYLFLIIGVPLVFYLGAAWKGTLFTDPSPIATLQSLFVAFVLGLIKGPVEEFGWRGFAMPILQRKLAPIWAALLLGIIWGLWHLPAFLLSGTQQSTWSFLPFFVGTITISVIITALFNASKGSILLAAFMHFQLMNPIWPDAQPYDTYILIIIAVVVVWLHRNTIFSKRSGITEIVPSLKCSCKEFYLCQ